MGQHLEAVKGYLLMTHWRASKEEEEDIKRWQRMGRDKSWIFLVVVGFSLAVLTTGLLLL